MTTHLSRLLKTPQNPPQNNPPIDRSRHQSQNQYILPNATIERTTKTN